MKSAADVPTLASMRQADPDFRDYLKWHQRLALACRAHWLRILTTAAAMYIGLGLLAPLLMMWGWQASAKAIYALYSALCHQFAHRSWFIFGQSTSYASEQLRELTGIDPNTTIGRLDARSFTGNAALGWKSAYCQRDMAIYVGVLIFSLLYALLRERRLRIQNVPWLLYFVIGLVPITLDSLSQMLSQSPFALPFPIWRESTPILRTLTGLLFGGMNAWLAYPHLEEWMTEVHPRHVRT